VQVAFQQADYVAWNVWAAINGRPLLPFKYQHLGDMMSLGSVNGAVTLPLPVPSQLADSLQVSIFVLCVASHIFPLPLPSPSP
jgi:NADH dehydrogenase FAD-containing subunit